MQQIQAPYWALAVRILATVVRYRYLAAPEGPIVQVFIVCCTAYYRQTLHRRSHFPAHNQIFPSCKRHNISVHIHLLFCRLRPVLADLLISDLVSFSHKRKPALTSQCIMHYRETARWETTTGHMCGLSLSIPLASASSPRQDIDTNNNSAHFLNQHNYFPCNETYDWEDG